LLHAATFAQNIERVDPEQQHHRADDQERGQAEPAASPDWYGNLHAATAAAGKRETEAAAAFRSPILDIPAFAIAFVVAHGFKLLSRAKCGTNRARLDFQLT
jgi:hypothetical protein